MAPKRLTAWHGHSAAVTALEHVEHENGIFIISCSSDCTVRMWTVHGHFVGTFGQDIAWNLGQYNEQTTDNQWTNKHKRQFEVANGI